MAPRHQVWHGRIRPGQEDPLPPRSPCATMALEEIPREMADTETATEPVGERDQTDKSPEAVQEAQAQAEAEGGPTPGQRAEVSNLDIVRHYFEVACDHLGLADDLRVVFWAPYREVTVQIPIRLPDGKV